MWHSFVCNGCGATQQMPTYEVDKQKELKCPCGSTQWHLKGFPDYPAPFNR